MKYVIIDKSTNKILHFYTLPVDDNTGKQYTADQITVADNVKLQLVDDSFGIGDIVTD